VADKNKEKAMQMLRNNGKMLAAVVLAGLTLSTGAHATEGGSFMDMAKEAGIMGGLLLLTSVAGFALSFQALVAIRVHLMRPPELATELINCVQEGNLDGAVEAAQSDGSFLGAVAFATLSNAQYGKESMESAMSDTGEIEANKFLAKIGVLQLIAAIAPMLGLTGTTIGMIFTFSAIAAKADAVTTADMAKGIGVALVCTFMGLMVAIPLLVISFFLKLRVQQVILEIANDCNEMIRILQGGEQAEA
jgi:biopolymer transport protein ExbB